MAGVFEPRFVFLLCHAAFLDTEACFSVIFAPTGLCNTKAICLEVRKPDQWDMLPELPLMGCTGVFAFLSPTPRKLLSLLRTPTRVSSLGTVWQRNEAAGGQKPLLGGSATSEFHFGCCNMLENGGVL